MSYDDFMRPKLLDYNSYKKIAKYIEKNCVLLLHRF